jgi:hypothetical protein
MAMKTSNSGSRSKADAAKGAAAADGDRPPSSPNPISSQPNQQMDAINGATEASASQAKPKRIRMKWEDR